MLTREQLVEPKTKTIKVEQGEVKIRALTAAEAFELRGKDMQSAEIFALIAKSLVDPILTAEDVGKLPVSSVNQITTEMLAFNGMGVKAITEATDDLKKTQAEG